MKSKNKGHLFIISGPSGAGKGTLRKILFKRVPGLVFSVSCTTRLPRRGEVDGIDYHFIDDASFHDLKDNGQFLEWAEVHGHYYGTLREDVDRTLSAGKDIILEIDVQGAHQVKKNCSDAVMIFITPPSMPELETRLRKRGTEEENTLRIRLKNARGEMDDSSSFDYVIVNDKLEKAVKKLEFIIDTYREDTVALEE